MLTVRPIAISTTKTNANDASAGKTANDQAAISLADRQQQVIKQLNFTQNNTSPKALSEVEIYRQTKNQLSIAKGALTSP